MKLPAILLLLLAPPAAGSPPDVVEDLSRVVGIRWLKEHPHLLGLLKRNGFVVAPRYRHQIFTPYLSSDLPPFVTTDSVFWLYHHIFEEQLLALESHMTDRVAALTRGVLAALGKEEDSPSRDRLLAFFSVAARLQDPGFVPPPPAGVLVPGQVARILRAAGVEPTAIFPGYPRGLDYTQFKPRGIYTRTEKLQRFFRVMTWYGSCPFRLRSPAETRCALLLADLFRRDRELRQEWEAVSGLYDRLVGPPDDLTLADYLRVLGPGPLPDPEVFRRNAAGLRQPQICGMVLAPGQEHRWRESTRGLCFLGRRFLPDGGVFRALTHPRVPDRALPAGLDLMATAGSGRAEGLLEEAGTLDRPGFRAGLAEAKGRLARYMENPADRHYAHFLRLLETWFQPPPAQAPPCMRTEAWADKSLVTSLAAWASMRHAWQLQAKPDFMLAGEICREGFPGFVEPNLPFYDRMDRLAGLTMDLLAPIPGVDLPRLKEFRRLNARLRTIARKELDGRSPDRTEARLLLGYGDRLGELSYFKHNSYIAGESLPWMALVADVASEYLVLNRTLQVGTGGAMPIYVVVPHGGRLHLLKGGVYSYREFHWPLAKRLTDEEWRELWENGEPPPPPAWTASFTAALDADAVLDRLRRGRVVDSIRGIADPRIARVLAEELGKGGALAQADWWERDRAWKEYARRVGRRALPLLLAELETRRRDQFDDLLAVIRPLLEGKDTAMLLDLALSSTNPDFHQGLDLLTHARGPATVRAVLTLARKGRRKMQRESALFWLGWNAPVDLVPDLVDLYRELPRPLQGEALKALARIWTDTQLRQTENGIIISTSHRPEARATPLQKAISFARTLALVLERIRAGDEDAAEAARILQEAFLEREE